MKKITLVLVLFTIGLQAQTFPSPYCEIADGISVEEITSVNFNTANIVNADAVSDLIDKTTTIVNVSPNQSYTLTVNGNTYGNFDTNIVAFIDWNQNDILDDANEVYAIGTLSNTDGNTEADAVSATITIPSDALIGNTRIRITKTYTDSESTAIVDPCAISFNVFGMSIQPGFGQALDFTLNIETLSINEFDTSALNVYPTPINNILNIDYKSQLTAVKIYGLLGQEVLAKKVTESYIKLDVSQLNPGVYIVKLFTENGQHSFRTVKQ